MSSLLTPELKTAFEKIVARYPADQKQSAVIPLLHLLQEKNGGSLTLEHQKAVADYLAVPLAKVHEVTTFYTMFSLEPRGRAHISLCRTLPCELNGCGAVTAAVRRRLGVPPKTVTPDGKFSFEEVECLAACHEGPVMQIGDKVYGQLTPEKVVAIIDELEKKL
jgi:NADH-quinone oxidoreductase subunit E